MKIGDEVYIHGYVDEIRKDTVIIRNEGGYFGTVQEEISVNQEPKTGHWRHYEGMLICSKCGSEFYDDIMEYCGDDFPKCCPDCGCRMVEPQESEE